MISLFILLPLSFTIPTIFGYKVFEKAGEAGWKTLIPFYNLYIWLKIIEKPMWWYAFLLIPFINVFVYMLMVVELVKCFKKNGLLEQGIAAVFPFIYLPFLGFNHNEEFIRPQDLPKTKKSFIREWTDAIIFAVIAASIIRIFLFEAYSIPTSSMEKSLLVGDFLFVSKIAYGPRAPMTPIAFPFVHHTMPFSRTAKSYTEAVKLPYFRFPGLSEVERNDAVVFNFPDGDTLSLRFQSEVSYHTIAREYGRERILRDEYNFGKIISRPLDKRENFIKRCVGMPGDKLEIVDQVVMIDDEKLLSPGKMQFKYKIVTDGSRINPRILDKYDITEDVFSGNLGEFILTLTEDAAIGLEKLAIVKSVDQIIEPKGLRDPRIFPYSSDYNWNVDNFGPIIIPKKGATIDLNLTNLPLYTRIIGAFEHNELAITEGKIMINGKEANTYTFKQDYFWLMGDNRHNSMDSRYWGFVPEDHIVGKASFVWFSLDNNKSLFGGKIRWNKMFRIIK
jgi:signal peptidase I